MSPYLLSSRCPWKSQTCYSVDVPGRVLIENSWHTQKRMTEEDLFADLAQRNHKRGCTSLCLLAARLFLHWSEGWGEVMGLRIVKEQVSCHSVRYLEKITRFPQASKREQVGKWPSLPLLPLSQSFCSCSPWSPAYEDQTYRVLAESRDKMGRVG